MQVPSYSSKDTATLMAGYTIASVALRSTGDMVWKNGSSRTGKGHRLSATEKVEKVEQSMEQRGGRTQMVDRELLSTFKT